MENWQIQLGIIVKAEEMLSKLETEAREIYNSPDDLHPEEIKELIFLLADTRKKVLEIGSKIGPDDEYDIRYILGEKK